MTTENTKLGREPLVVCGLVMDKCSQVAGVGACFATETGNSKCYNTRATCNYSAAYTKTTQEIKFTSPRSNLPIGENLFPVLDGKIDRASTSTTAGSGLGKRAVVSVKIKDFPHHDRGIDPYYDERTYDALTTGTFWGKFLKRNPYYEGRTLKLYHGYLTEPFDWANFHVEEYDISDIAGPTNGMVKITAKDILVRTYERKAKYPELSVGTLSADMTTVASTFSVGAGEGAAYPTSGTIAIGKEAMSFTRSVDTFTVTRNTWGTELKDHKIGDTVQICQEWNSVNIVDALYDLLINTVGIPSAYINLTAWNLERDTWLSGANVKGILIKPEGVEKIISEWSEAFMFDIWWDAGTQLIEFKALSPAVSGGVSATITDEANIKQGTLQIDRVSKERYTQIEIFYNKIDYSDNDDLKNFANGFITSDPSRAGSDKYDSQSIKTIKTRWIDDASVASQLAGRLLARYADTPEYLSFKIDAKDYGKLKLSELVDVTTWQFQDFNGNTETRAFQIIEIDEIDSGHELRVKCLTSSFTGSYFFFAPETAPDYATATADEKAAYGYFVDDTGIHPDSIAGDKFV